MSVSSLVDLLVQVRVGHASVGRTTAIYAGFLDVCRVFDCQTVSIASSLRLVEFEIID